tara:strand:+ start:13662 stop:15812 length:2151 start_codon:yes stop_codon:yes gene_type:complete
MQHSNIHFKKDLNNQETYESLKTFFKEDSEFLYLLKPLLKALGWPGHHRHLIETLPHFHDALDLTDFRNVFAKLNYTSYSIKGELSDIEQGILPCLFIPNDEPSYIITAKTKDSFIIHHSEQKEKTEIPNHLKSEGTIFVFKEAGANNINTKTKNWFLETLSHYKSLFYQIAIISMILNLFLLATPIFIMTAYDKIIPTGSQSMIFHFMTGAVIFLLGGMALQSMRARIIAHIGARLDTTIGDTIFEHLLYLPPSFTESASVGAQISRIKDFDSVRDFVTSPFIPSLFELPFTIIALVIIGSLSGMLVFVPIIMILIFIGLFYTSHSLVNKISKQSSDDNVVKETFEIEALSHLREVKSLCCEKIWVNRFKEISSRATFSEFKSSFITFILDTVSDSIVILSGLTVVAIGVQLVINEDMSAGALIAVMMLVWRTLSPIKLFFSMLPRLDKINTSIQQINRLMKIKVERDPHKLIAPIQAKEGKIDLARVSFRYKNNLPPALLGVTLSIEPGEIVCIIGKNGSGKSTLCKLLTQMYLPQGGAIFLDNSNIRQLDPIELRHAIAYLPQKSSLFFGTILQNLKFSNITATEAEINLACKKAGVYKNIMDLPLGFDTHIDDCSSDLYSATFKQKIALARTYLKASPIMVLDEPTSHLNNIDDKLFMQTINDLKGKVSTILITHRPAHMRMADKIFYFEQGQIALQGRPEDILPKISFESL